MKYTGVEEQIEYGLDTVEQGRVIEVNLRDLMYIHQTLGELNRFFHQSQHYPTVNDVEKFMGDIEAGGAYRAIHNCLYNLMPGMLPEDIDQAFGEGDRFEHPDPPYYYQTKKQNKSCEATGDNVPS